MANRSQRIVQFIVKSAVCAGFLIGCVTAYNFPYDVGPPTQNDALSESAAYYQDAYTPGDNGGDRSYVEVARRAGDSDGIVQDVAKFTSRYALTQARTLEVGAGSGTLQDVTENYTGLDIADSAAPFFHKPFVQGSATALPFPDDSFDVIWSVWTLEHVPDPELALSEDEACGPRRGLPVPAPGMEQPNLGVGALLGRPEGESAHGGSAQIGVDSCPRAQRHV